VPTLPSLFTCLLPLFPLHHPLQAKTGLAPLRGSFGYPGGGNPSANREAEALRRDAPHFLLQLPPPPPPPRSPPLPRGRRPPSLPGSDVLWSGGEQCYASEVPGATGWGHAPWALGPAPTRCPLYEVIRVLGRDRYGAPGSAAAGRMCRGAECVGGMRLLRPKLCLGAPSSVRLLRRYASCLSSQRCAGGPAGTRLLRAPGAALAARPSRNPRLHTAPERIVPACGAGSPSAEGQERTASSKLSHCGLAAPEARRSPRLPREKAPGELQHCARGSLLRVARLAALACSLVGLQLRPDFSSLPRPF
jgi:hypothetical protein